MIMETVKRGFVLALPLAVLTACASTPKLGGDPNLKVSSGTELPVPSRQDLTAQARPYYVGPFDKLMIDTFGIAELSGREVQVDENGMITFAPAGLIDVGGKTAGEIEQILAAALRASHVRNPQVAVRLKETVSQVVTVEGEVKNPGLYPIFGRMTLLRAMALADGTTEFAKLSDVVIFRTVNGQRYAALYNVKDIRHGAQPDPEVFANDIVTVGDSATRRFLKDMVALSPLLTTPIIVIDNLTR